MPQDGSPTRDPPDAPNGCAFLLLFAHIKLGATPRVCPNFGLVRREPMKARTTFKLVLAQLALAQFALAATFAVVAPARADVAPDPADPAGPYSMVALVLVLVATGVYLYRRRRK